ncbi:MAG: hypothetical protein HY894_04130 [Deltaproteobacteria bacterium]|nr:hypothetical protein [Deltaproteobacteria bacterium]
MAQDFTAYTEVDPNAHITVTASRIDVATLGRNEDAYVYKDYGSAYFNANFTHELELQFCAAAATVAAAFPCALTNIVGGIKGIETASGDHQSILVFYDGALKIGLKESDGGTAYSSYALTSAAFGTIYYARFYRDEAVGTYGTLYLYLYTDAARTVLAGSTSITLHTSKKDFRYLYGVSAYNTSLASNTITGWVQNLDLGNSAIYAGSGGFVMGGSARVRFAGPNSCICPIQWYLSDNAGAPITGAAALTTAKVLRVDDGAIMDCHDDTFKTAGWLSAGYAMSEVDPLNLPGFYEESVDVGSFADGWYLLTASYSGTPLQTGPAHIYVKDGKFTDALLGIKASQASLDTHGPPARRCKRHSPPSTTQHRRQLRPYPLTPRLIRITLRRGRQSSIVLMRLYRAVWRG